MRNIKARTWYNQRLYFLIPLLLLHTHKATARGLIFSERAYVNVGFGEFQCERFQGTEGEYIKSNVRASHVFNLGVGYKISTHISSDINVQSTKLFYKANEPKARLRQKIAILSGMINLYYNLYEEALINPYMTAGIGMSRNTARDLIDISKDVRFKGRSTTNLAWNLGGGILLNTMSRDYEINIGYRYMDYGIIQIKTMDPVHVYVTQKIRGHLGIISVLFKL
jgi:opacity protein-like surface antigen